jgi:hypothetical protein
MGKRTERTERTEGGWIYLTGKRGADLFRGKRGRIYLGEMGKRTERQKGDKTERGPERGRIYLTRTERGRIYLTGKRGGGFI